MSIADSAVGAILEIPPTALQDIRKAEAAIWSLHDASKKAADQVYGDFSKRMPMGVDAFIRKLREAVETMNGISGAKIDFNVNTNNAAQNINATAKQIKDDMNSISATVQTIAQSFNFDNAEQTFKHFYATLGQAEQGLKRFQDARRQMSNDDPEIDKYNRIIELLKEYIALEQRSKEAKKNKTTKADDEYLSQQKQLLADILNLRKQINTNQISAARTYQTGGDTSKERRNIDELLVKLREANTAYRELERSKAGSLSIKGQADAENNALRQEVALLKESNSAREKLNQNISRGYELANQAKLKSAGLGSTDDSIYQRTLTNLYKDQIAVLKEVGKVRADVAGEGRRATDSEREKLELLAQKYRELQTAINQTSGKYTKIDQNVQSNFVAERDRQIIENTILKEQAERKYQETVAKTQQIIAGKVDLSGTLESITKLRQEEQRLFDQVVRLQNLINQLKQERVEIKFNMNADFQSKIQPLVERLRELRQLTKQPLDTDKLKEYYREIDILKEKIASATAAANVQSANNPALLGNQEQIDALTNRYVALSAEMQNVGIEANKLGAVWVQQNEANKALDTQAQRLSVLEQRLQNLNALWERLKATNQAYNADGTLTDKGKRLVAIENEIKNEIALRRMTASDAKKYEEQKTRDAENESKKRIDKAKREAKETRDALNEQKKQSISNPQGAIDYAKNARNLRELTDAYKNLQNIMNNTDPKSQAWKDLNNQLGRVGTKIENIKSKMNELHSQSSKTSNLMGQLQGRIAAAFSVGAITNFIKKMVETRAQFELQRVALGAIIQDRDEANKIFTQVQNMALESPFNIMQLEKATKQIAAFGFETKKLVPTMKMFADISAGLGVEIDRLVLVMGHLKARNFLEGTMVRQFTNMGFNVLGELSKYYTELEGKMVSVGEVQDRVKKKMISFEDVEEVLKRVTSAGGMFYDMQRKQSDSLWGQMQRIQDAYDLMLNEIGQSNEGVLKSALSTIRDLINHWRELKPVIVSTVAAMGTFGAAMFFLRGLPLLLSQVKNGYELMKIAILKTKDAQLALNAAQKANAWGALIAAVTAALVVVYEWITTQSQLKESMDRVRNEGISNMYDLITQYRQLADTVKDTTKPYEERKKALDELHRVYGDILPAEMLEINNIRQMKDGYDEATEAIRTYSEEKTKANLKAEVENIVGKDIQEKVNNISDAMADLLEDWDNLPDNIPKDTFRRIASTMMTEISEEVKNGTIPVEKAIDVLKQRMKERLRGFFSAQDIDTLFSRFGNWDPFQSTFVDWKKQLQKYQNEVKGIDIGSSGIDKDNPDIKHFENLRTAVSEATGAIENLKDVQFQATGGVQTGEDGKITNFQITEEERMAVDDFNQKLEVMNGLLRQIGMDELTISSEEFSNVLASDAESAELVSQVIKDKLIERLDFLISKTKDPALKKYFERLRNEINQTTLTPIQDSVIETEKMIVQKLGLKSTAVFNKLKIAGMTSFSDVAKKAKKLSDEASENVKKITEIEIELIRLGMTAKEARAEAIKRVGDGKTTKEEYEQEAKATLEMAKAYGYYDKSKKKSSKSSDKELKRWQDLKKAIESVRTAYEKARKSFTVDESNKMIEERWGDVFKALGVNIKDFYKNGVYDMEALVKAYDVLIEKAKKAATTEERKKSLSEMIASQKDTEIEIKVKLQEDAEKKLKKDLDDMFANYELTEEFKKLGINVDLTYMLGGKPTTLQDIRNEIARLKAEGGDKKDAENRIKILEEQEKKITQMEIKAQKERLKNYEKYLKKMYSDRAKKMIEAYTDMKNIEYDFNSFIEKLQSEAEQDDTTPERKAQIAEQIKSLRFQKEEAIKAVNESLSQNLAKLDWEQFKGSDVFTQLYQDTENLSKKGIDLLIKKLTDARTALQSMDKVDYRAVREITNHIEKLQDIKIDTGSWRELNGIIKAAKTTIGDISLEDAQQNMINAQSRIDAAKIEIANIQAIIDLKEQEGSEEDKTKGLTEEQLNLYKESGDLLRAKLKVQEDIVEQNQKEVDTNKEIVDAYEDERKAINKKTAIVNKLQEDFNKVYNSVVDVADALGNDTDIWADFGQAIADSVFSCITLALQMQLLGIASNSALGIIGWVATALQVVANLLVAIFKHHDKILQNQIDDLQDKVDTLSKSFEKLEESIERAFTIASENNMTEEALRNITQQKQAYEEMMRLEEAKKKTDDDRIKEYKDKLDELAEAENELYEKRHEKYGSTNDVWDEANNFVDAWLDAYKETGDGLDALNDSWDEFYENLVKKQAASAVLGKRMDKYIKEINDAIDKNMGSEYDYIDMFKDIGERMKSEFDATNEDLKKIFEYAGIGNSGSLLLSDLQKGIQNITEPQAAAIEAYLNSMRFAVFRHTEQLDILIATIQMQYGNNSENPVVAELKGIRGVLDSIDRRLGSVINTQGRNAVLRVGV